MNNKKKKCQHCREKPVTCKQAKYCSDCRPVVAKAQRRESNKRVRAQYVKPGAAPKAAKMSWADRRARIMECVNAFHYTNRLTPRQAAGMR